MERDRAREGGDGGLEVCCFQRQGGIWAKRGHAAIPPAGPSAGKLCEGRKAPLLKAVRKGLSWKKFYSTSGQDVLETEAPKTELFIWARPDSGQRCPLDSNPELPCAPIHPHPGTIASAVPKGTSLRMQGWRGD